MSNLPQRRAAMDVPTARATIVRMVPEFARALPPGVDPQRFARVAQTALQQNPKLLECTPDSVWGACMKAAQDGLLPDGREGAMVPRWNGKAKRVEAHWMPMVAGLIAKAKRKGNVASLSAQIVYNGEEFDFLMGDDERIVHRRDVSKVKRGQEKAVYAIATMRDGAKEREVMSWEQVLQVAAVSADRDSGDVTAVWKQWPEEMARKSCIRRLSKRLPSLDEGDDDLKRAVERVDELYDFGKAPVLAAEPRRQAITHDAPEPTMDLPALDTPEPVPVRDSRAALTEALSGDDLPNFDAPALDPEPPPSGSMREEAQRIQGQRPDSPAQAVIKLARQAETIADGGNLLSVWASQADALEALRGTEAWGPLEREVGAGLKRSLGTDPAAAFVTALRAQTAEHLDALQGLWDNRWADTLDAMQEEAPATFTALRKHVATQIARVRGTGASPDLPMDGHPAERAAEGTRGEG